MSEKQLIHEKIIAVMTDCKAIGKTQKNTVQNYQFRGIDGVYNELQAVLSKHGVFSVPHILSERSEERKSRNGGLLIYRILGIEYTFYATDGSFIKCDVIGEGMDSGDKASNKAMSVAHKYALLQVFCIPTEDPKDPENDSPDPEPKTEESPNQTTKPQRPKSNDTVDTWKKWIDLAKSKNAPNATVWDHFNANTPKQEKYAGLVKAYLESIFTTPF